MKKDIMDKIKKGLSLVKKYLYNLFIHNNSIKYIISSLILFPVFFILFFKIVNIDKQLSYVADYGTKYIRDAVNLSLNPVDVSYISKVISTFKSSEEKPEIVIITDNRTIADINKEANTLFNKIGIGSEKYNNGLLIYLNNNPNPSIRLEIGYGLEDVINDAKAGRILDNNIKKVSNKPLSEFNNDELRQLLPLVFKDTAALIADKYNIDISNIKAIDEPDLSKQNKKVKVYYSINNVEPYFIVLFFLTAFLLFIIIPLSNFAYGLFIISLISVTGYIFYLYESIFSIIFILISYVIPFVTASWFSFFPKRYFDIQMGYSTYFIREFPYKIDKLHRQENDKKSSFDNFIKNNVLFKKIFSFEGKSFFNINHKFMFVTAVIFTTIYYLILESFISFGLGNIILDIVALIVIVISLFLMWYGEAYVVMFFYSLSLSFMLGSYIPYNFLVYKLFFFPLLLNILIGYRIYDDILSMKEKRLTFFTIFEIIIRIVLFVILRGGGKSGGGRSGGGGASR